MSLNGAEKMIELLKFSHDRKAPLNESCNALMDIIDAFAEQPTLDNWYSYFEKTYLLPRDVVKQQMKVYLAGSYDYRKCSFLHKLFVKNILSSVVRHIGFLFYTCIKSKKHFHKNKEFELIVDDIETDVEVKRFSRLIDLFKNVLVVNVNSATGLGYKTVYYPRYKFYDRNKTIYTLYWEIFRGLPIYLKLSIKYKINFITIAGHLINDYLHYYTIFKYNRAKYCIQERHYHTSTIKNYLFKFFGGICSSCIQKNLLMLGPIGFYYDIDVFFTLGTKTAKRAFGCGARINQVVPVGSVFMEYYWFIQKKGKCLLEKKYDIVCLGINLIGFQDTYETYLQDYYEHFQWLAEFSKENPELIIGIKHHSNNKLDHREMEIIKNSNVVRIDQKLNSYEVAFQAKCCVTFCSTMGYELIAHGMPTVFLDPGRRNIGILPDDDLIDGWRVINYKEFKRKMNSLLTKKDLNYGNIVPDDLCLNSKNVSEKIYASLTECMNNFTI